MKTILLIKDDSDLLKSKELVKTITGFPAPLGHEAASITLWPAV